MLIKILLHLLVLAICGFSIHMAYEFFNCAEGGWVSFLFALLFIAIAKVSICSLPIIWKMERGRSFGFSFLIFFLLMPFLGGAQDTNDCNKWAETVEATDFTKNTGSRDAGIYMYKLVVESECPSIETLETLEKIQKKWGTKTRMVGWILDYKPSFYNNLSSEEKITFLKIMGFSNFDSPSGKIDKKTTKRIKKALRKRWDHKKIKALSMENSSDIISFGIQENRLSEIVDAFLIPSYLMDKEMKELLILHSLTEELDCYQSLKDGQEYKDMHYLTENLFLYE